MKHVIRKAYWDYEKEENWLNKMSAMGLALVDYTWCRYVFESTPSNEFTYRIELLENYPSHPDSAAYLQFLEESGIECVSTYMKWVYLRKRTIEGPFDIYTDIDSKIKYLKRVYTFWKSLILMELIIGLMNIVIAIICSSVTNLLCGLLCSAIGLCLYKMNAYTGSKLKKLEQESLIKE